MHDVSELLDRVRRGQSDRAIAQDLGRSRVTVRKYREAFAGLDTTATATRLGEHAQRERRPAQTISGVTP